MRLVPEPVPDVLDVRLTTIRVLVELILGPLEELRTQGAHVLVPAHLVSETQGLADWLVDLLTRRHLMKTIEIR